MKSFEVREFGIDNLSRVERDVPRPGEHEVLVRMTAASLNYRDYLVVTGAYDPRMKRPMVPLSDGCGVIEETGTAVTRFQKGDRVAACFMQSWIEGPPTREKGASALGGAIDGVLREFAVFSAEGLVRAPASLTHEETAALPCAAVTAWHALFEDTSAVPGDTVLIQGTGGVSIFALQFAKLAGMRTIVTSSSDEKLKRAKALGADECINYKTTSKWEEEARKLTNGVGVDQVIEVGGSGTMPRSLRAVRMDGVISVIGVLGGADPSVSPVPILMNSLRARGIYVGSRAMFERMNRAIELHRLKPVVDRVFPWTEIKDALRYMESQQHFGKICLKF
ncbi:MAG: NAD(P)-dependent alcohol dehydrogenase [Acidobacteriaceae bacterium]|nr:NAD(P)-dependent alcohol dehydrogenase [Acidobacteriaceae bacterium]MBV9294384.1 NAD(P)-dependent alcohol dehydrogenase [Acidobacteriaceae bacterium]MBV9767280.1 NAD(P)-dependent alcohol dehydrogenase [Acidobacteriaceae bacterium]